MRSFLKVFFTGLFISFLGTLPVGTMNVVAMQISYEESIRQAYLFALGAVLVEMIYVRLALVGIDWIVKRKKLMQYMEWATFFIILALAAGSFIAAMRGGSGARNVFLDNSLNRFLLGMVMNALNPVQIPFWFGWSTILLTKGVIKPEKNSYNIFVIGLAIGTLLGKTIYILGGSWLISKLSNAQDYMNWIIGGVFAITAIIQLIRILTKKGIGGKIDKMEKE